MWKRKATSDWPSSMLIALLLPSHLPAHRLFHCQIPHHSLARVPWPCEHASLFPPNYSAPSPLLVRADAIPYGHQAVHRRLRAAIQDGSGFKGVTNAPVQHRQDGAASPAELRQTPSHCQAANIDRERFYCFHTLPTQPGLFLVKVA